MKLESNSPAQSGAPGPAEPSHDVVTDCQNPAQTTGYFAP